MNPPALGVQFVPTLPHHGRRSNIALASAVSIRRECLRLQAYMAIRNKEGAMLIFEKVQKVDIFMNVRSQNPFSDMPQHRTVAPVIRHCSLLLQSFHNMLWETRSELSALATLRKFNMNSRLAVKGNAVTDVFFVIRGECVARSGSSNSSSTNISNIKHVERVEEIRCGPGHIVGW